MSIKLGDEVAIHYTMKLQNGEVVETTRGKEPARFTLGSDGVLPGLKEALINSKKGDRKRVTVPPSKGFGDVIQDLFREVPISLVKRKLKQPSPGAVIKIPTEGKSQILARIHDIKNDSVIVDFNHPLAGETLTFDIEVVDVRHLTKYIS